jgi:dynein intermediate chain 4, axonemal
MSRIRSSALNAAAAQKIAEQVVVVEISETETEILLALPSLVISTELRESKEVDESNKAYDAIVEAHKNPDGFTARLTQTINNPQKNQNEMAAPNPSQDAGCQALAYDIMDSQAGEKRAQNDDYSILPDSEGTDYDRDAGLSSHVARFVHDTVKMSLGTPGCLLDVTDLFTAPLNNPTAAAASKTSGPSKNPSGGKHSDSGGDKANTRAKASSQEGGGPDGSGPRNSGSNPNNLSGALGEDEDTFDSDERGVIVGYDSLKALEEANREAVLLSPSIMKKLLMVERAVQQNAYHRQILDYRDFPDVKPLSLLADNEKVSVVDSVDHLFGGGLSLGRGGTAGGVSGLGGSSILDQDGVGSGLNRKASNLVSSAAGADDGGQGGALTAAAQEMSAQTKVRKLFAYSAPTLVRGRPVTCMSWNSENKDILAVGYGKVDFLPTTTQPARGSKGEELSEEELASGLVLFWSLRNPDYPEKVLRTPHAITAIDFSKRNPSLLAVGFYNGDIAVYDVRREGDWEKPVETSAGMAGSHSDPVW